MNSDHKVIDLALQGGGSHGAFTWGVLDRLLEDGRISVGSVSATSAGTMNALCVAHGLQQGQSVQEGHALAREKLEQFWTRISAARNFYGTNYNGAGFSALPGTAPIWWMVEQSMRMMSPYFWNHLDYNPLRNVLEECFDFAALRAGDCVKLYIAATNVRTGKVRVFNASELSIDVVMASACLPFLFKAVEIDGEHYWDGGFSGNPALYPLLTQAESRDVLVVHVNPIKREAVPESSPEIMNRMNEITFNGSLLKELRAVAFLKRLDTEGMLTEDARKRFRNLTIHAVRAEDHIADLSETSKFNTSWNLISSLRDRGRAAMDQWLDENFDALGKRDTIDLDEEFATSMALLFGDE